MKIVFVDTYYPKVLNDFRLKHPDYSKYSYQKYKKLLIAICFGTSDFFSYYFNKLGWNAEDLIVNDEVLQKKWARENKIKIKENYLLNKIRNLPYIYKVLGRPQWMQQIALAQIKKTSPDVVYCQDLSILNPQTLQKVKRHCKILVGQIASPMPPRNYLKKFDLIISSFPHFVKEFKKMGINGVYQKLAFDPRVLKHIKKQQRIYDVTFVGSFTPHHIEGTKILEKVAEKIPIHVWGQGVEFLSPNSPLRKNYHGEAWGVDMYKVLAQSKIVLNRHISAADGYANNMRLYESTGMGAMLVTDKKKNLNDLFDVGKEVVEYSNPKDLINKIKNYLSHPKDLNVIARNGEKRTILEHGYPERMSELSKILLKYLKNK